MNELYEKLAKYRDENFDKDDYKYTKDVLNQLLVTAFNNRNAPGKLPKVFNIVDVHYTTEQLENLMKEIGYESEVHMRARNWNKRIASFIVTIVKK